jgi:hypothetical protein
MKSPLLCLALAFACTLVASGSAAAETGRVYELRTYTATPGNTAAMMARFRNHTLKLFEKHGMTNVGYWVPAEAKDGAADKLVYLLAYPSREAARASWRAFSADPEWQAVRKASEVNGRIVGKVESVYLTETNYSGSMTDGAGQGAPRAFELRTYTAAEGKLGALDARFSNHTIGLFRKHGITTLGFFHPIDADKGAGSTLIYFMAHRSREAAAASIQAFRENPEWLKARAASEKDGRLTTKVESVFLVPAEFSPLK